MMLLMFLQHVVGFRFRLIHSVFLLLADGRLALGGPLLQGHLLEEQEAVLVPTDSFLQCLFLFFFLLLLVQKDGRRASGAGMEPLVMVRVGPAFGVSTAGVGGVAGPRAVRVVHVEDLADPVLKSGGIECVRIILLYTRILSIFSCPAH